MGGCHGSTTFGCCPCTTFRGREFINNPLLLSIENKNHVAITQQIFKKVISKEATSAGASAPAFRPARSGAGKSAPYPKARISPLFGLRQMLSFLVEGDNRVIKRDPAQVCSQIGKSRFGDGFGMVVAEVDFRPAEIGFEWYGLKCWLPIRCRQS